MPIQINKLLESYWFLVSYLFQYIATTPTIHVFSIAVLKLIFVC